MSKLTKTIKELTGEDAVDMFGGDAENIVEELNKESVCGNCKQPYRGETLCPHTKTSNEWEKGLEEFAIINEMHIRGFPMGKLQAFIKKLLSSERQRLREEIEKYNELIFAVGKKYESETRHETALRYIRQAEQNTDQASQKS